MSNERKRSIILSRKQMLKEKLESPRCVSETDILVSSQSDFGYAQCHLMRKSSDRSLKQQSFISIVFKE